LENGNNIYAHFFFSKFISSVRHLARVKGAKVQSFKDSKFKVLKIENFSNKGQFNKRLLFFLRSDLVRQFALLVFFSVFSFSCLKKQEEGAIVRSGIQEKYDFHNLNFIVF
jgi:hypothetical protein